MVPFDNGRAVESTHFGLVEDSAILGENNAHYESECWVTQTATAGGRPTILVDLLQPSPTPGESDRRRRLRRAGLWIVALLALAICLTQIWVPYPWPDEAATVSAVDRTWPGLWRLLGGQDAPLVPYYVLTKLWHTLLPWLSTLVAARVLSAVAAAATLACLYSLVVRRNGVLVASLASGFLISLPGFIRWAQDARPYSLLMLTTAAAWLAWSTRRPWEPTSLLRWSSWSRVLRNGWGYGALLGASVSISLFAAFQWPAQVLAELVTSPKRDRWKRVLATVMVMAATLVVFAVPIWVSLTKGRGPQAVIELTLNQLGGDLLQLFSLHEHSWSIVMFVGLAAIAVVVAIFPTQRLWKAVRSYRDLARIATAWALLPLALSILFAVVRPNMLRTRYWVPALAPSAVLAAIGALVLAKLAYHGIRKLAAGLAWSGVLAQAVGAVVVLGLLLGQAALMAPEQRSVRGPNGHKMAMGEMLAYVTPLAAADPQLPILVSPSAGAALVNAVRPKWAPRNPGYFTSQASAWVWPAVSSPKSIQLALNGHHRMLWIEYPLHRNELVAPTSLPDQLSSSGFRIVAATHKGEYWVMDLERP